MLSITKITCAILLAACVLYALEEQQLYQRIKEMNIEGNGNIEIPVERYSSCLLMCTKLNCSGFSVLKEELKSKCVMTTDESRLPIGQWEIYLKQGLRCNQGWTQYKEKCLRISRQPAISLSVVRTYCQNVGGDAATIGSQDMTNYIYDSMGQTRNIFYPGIIKSGGQWRDLSGRPLTWTNWNAGEPGGEGNCIMVLSSNGKWNDIPCTKANPGNVTYICSFN